MDECEKFINYHQAKGISAIACANLDNSTLVESFGPSSRTLLLTLAVSIVLNLAEHAARTDGVPRDLLVLQFIDKLLAEEKGYNAHIVDLDICEGVE